MLHNQCDSSALRYTPDGGSLQQFTLRSFEFTLDNKLEDRRTLGSLLTSSPAITDIKKGVSFFIIYNSSETIDFKKLKESAEVLLERFKTKVF